MGTFLFTLSRSAVLIIGFTMAAGTLIGFSRHPHWAVRNWEFPRAQIAVIAATCGTLYAAVFFLSDWLDWFFITCMILTVGWQVIRILPYTPLATPMVQDSAEANPDAALRVVISNVQQKNRQYDHWIKVVTRENPDLILALETDEKWKEALNSLRTEYHSIRQVQANEYGMMLFSRQPLENERVRFIVQEDVPSIHTDVVLRNGRKIRFLGVHPRPPEPIRDKNSTARDAELVLIGRELAHDDQPTIIAGDLNDVAWSQTTELFIKVSRLLDPRRGRGFYNTFPADIPFFRYPLDHVFHSDAFRLVELRILESVGSDHLPVFIHLSYEPQAKSEQIRPKAEAEDQEFASQRVRREKQEEVNGTPS